VNFEKKVGKGVGPPDWGGGVSSHNVKRLNLKKMMGSVVGECHVPCRLNISFLDFEKEQHCRSYNNKIFSSL